MDSSEPHRQTDPILIGQVWAVPDEASHLKLFLFIWRSSERSFRSRHRREGVESGGVARIPCLQKAGQIRVVLHPRCPTRPPSVNGGTCKCHRDPSASNSALSDVRPRAHLLKPPIAIRDNCLNAPVANHTGAKRFRVRGPVRSLHSRRERPRESVVNLSASSRTARPICGWLGGRSVVTGRPRLQIFQDLDD